jgi:hypothetical protein
VALKAHVWGVARAHVNVTNLPYMHVVLLSAEKNGSSSSLSEPLTIKLHVTGDVLQCTQLTCSCEATAQFTTRQRNNVLTGKAMLCQ